MFKICADRNCSLITDTTVVCLICMRIPVSVTNAKILVISYSINILCSKDPNYLVNVTPLIQTHIGCWKLTTPSCKQFDYKY